MECFNCIFFVLLRCEKAKAKTRRLGTSMREQENEVKQARREINELNYLIKSTSNQMHILKLELLRAGSHRLKANVHGFLLSVLK